MYGPRAAGFWSSHADRTFRHLRAGSRYRVARRFVDFDGVTHDVGEEWTFVGASIFPHDSGVSLFVSLDDRQEWHIRLQDVAEAQRTIVVELAEYIVLVDQAVPR